MNRICQITVDLEMLLGGKMERDLRRQDTIAEKSATGNVSAESVAIDCRRWDKRYTLEQTEYHYLHLIRVLIMNVTLLWGNKFQGTRTTLYLHTCKAFYYKFTLTNIFVVLKDKNSEDFLNKRYFRNNQEFDCIERWLINVITKNWSKNIFLDHSIIPK